MKFYYLSANAYQMIAVEDGDKIYYLTEDRFDFDPLEEDSAESFLRDHAEDLAYNCSEWDVYDGTAEDFFSGCDIWATVEAN